MFSKLNILKIYYNLKMWRNNVTETMFGELFSTIYSSIAENASIKSEVVYFDDVHIKGTSSTSSTYMI